MLKWTVRAPGDAISHSSQQSQDLQYDIPSQHPQEHFYIPSQPQGQMIEQNNSNQQMLVVQQQNSTVQSNAQQQIINTLAYYNITPQPNVHYTQPYTNQSHLSDSFVTFSVPQPIDSTNKNIVYSTSQHQIEKFSYSTPKKSDSHLPQILNDSICKPFNSDFIPINESHLQNEFNHQITPQVHYNVKQSQITVNLKDSNKCWSETQVSHLIELNRHSFN